MKKRYKILIFISLIITVLIISFKIIISVNPPEIADRSILEVERTKDDHNIFRMEESWLKKNKYGLWELYLEGSDFELGVKNGKLTKELAKYQEEAFVETLREMIPSEFYIHFLKYFIAWFNKDIDEHVPLEYQKEIYGVSLSASKEFEFVAPNYHRILNYHAAHDIGHAINNMNLVACTAFGVKNERSADSSMIVGRNMDFYVGDKFAENKIVAFCEPENGHNFAYITWGGLIGVISGMNDKGLTITLNSAKSDIPTSAKKPVSILAREILQYASTIEEAYEIAKQSETFVAESFLISSAKDADFAIIEKSSSKTALFQTGKDEILLTNHYQSDEFKDRPLTIQNIKESESVYRWDRLNELLEQKKQHDVESFVDILRDQNGKSDKNIGMANEMSINQLIAHHSIVFKPQTLQMWISVGPYQLGEFIAYDLNKIFSDSLNIEKSISNPLLSVPEDSFLYSSDYKNFIEYKKLTKEIEHALSEENFDFLDESLIDKYKVLNPEYYFTYVMLAEIYYVLNDKNLAIQNLEFALTKSIGKESEIVSIKERLQEMSELKING